MTSPAGAAAALGPEPGYVAAGPVQVLAAGQAPGPAYYRVGLAADPEPGGALTAMDAQLVGARRHARHDQHGRPSGCTSRLACGRRGGSRSAAIAK
jgi:hypothetical protein